MLVAREHAAARWSGRGCQPVSAGPAFARPRCSACAAAAITAWSRPRTPAPCGRPVCPPAARRLRRRPGPCRSDRGPRRYIRGPRRAADRRRRAAPLPCPRRVALACPKRCRTSGSDAPASMASSRPRPGGAPPPPPCGSPEPSTSIPSHASRWPRYSTAPRRRCSRPLTLRPSPT